jgi:fatty-acid desaturase
VNKAKRDQYLIFTIVILCQLSLIPAIIIGTPGLWLLAFFVYFLMMGLGVSLLNHRILSHKSVNVNNRFIKIFLLFWSTVMLQGSTMAWVAMHREHHAYSDTERDPHGPNDGFWKSYWMSMFHTPSIRFIKDFIRDKDITFFHTHYWIINIAYSTMLYILFGFTGVLFLHLVPAAMTWHGVSMVNAVSHMKYNVPWIIGYRNFDTDEQSKNIPLAGYLTFGEAWHNNHHGRPREISFQLKWWEFDLVGKIGEFINGRF